MRFDPWSDDADGWSRARRGRDQRTELGSGAFAEGVRDDTGPHTRAAPVIHRQVSTLNA